MFRRQVDLSRELYGIDGWSMGYFSIGEESGEVCAHPLGDPAVSVRLPEVIEKAKAAGLALPLILRFPQIIATQLRRLDQAFQDAIWNCNYQGKHRGVFPFKVNQRREFIDNVVYYGKDLAYGLEVGSKTEFVAALSYSLHEDALLVCNGFKDQEFIELGFIGAQMGKNIIMVVEGPDELKKIIEQSKHWPQCPEIGMRVKLYSRGAGKWSKSSGDASKFGLTTLELLHGLKMIEEAHLADKFTMLHFHIGSQITEIKRVKNAIKEAARVYCKVKKMGFPLSQLDIGGGIGVDYDGSKTSFHSSANYSLQEFANDVIYQIGEVCNHEGIEHPDIITESGRVVAAYHSVVVTDIREIQSTEAGPPFEQLGLSPKDEKRHKNLKELQYIFEHINRKNHVEYYHDAIEYYDEVFTLFNLGYIDVEERAIAEQIFYRICQQALRFSSMEPHMLEEFEELQHRMVSKYLANFSIFQSIPDTWAIDQLFPVMPLSHHGEKPTLKANIVDITCDSDGCLEKFIDRRDVRSVLDLHDPKGLNYYLGFFLVGAYQESLANEHNLLGAINEVEILADGMDYKINKLTEGDPIDELLTARNYDTNEMLGNYEIQLRDHPPAETAMLLAKVQKILQSLPYLSSEGKAEPPPH